MNTLSPDVEIKGSITFGKQLSIEGKVEGDVISTGDLTIGESGMVKGQVKTCNVVIFGKVEGNVTVQERCQAKSTATILGDVTAGAFSADEGATFVGRSRVGKQAGATAAKPALGR
ncbi:MAG: polymer-forming cytoskeletal protein [Prosthecobacter sp.]|nr:polymer-forming cytoskeletal protein [Prosthecobacter sp.]